MEKSPEKRKIPKSGNTADGGDRSKAPFPPLFPRPLYTV